MGSSGRLSYGSAQLYRREVQGCDSWRIRQEEGSAETEDVMTRPHSALNLYESRTALLLLEPELLDLAARGPGQEFPEFDRARHLVVGHVRPAPADDRVRIGHLTCPRHHERLSDFPKSIIGDADHRGLGDARMREEDILDLGGVANKAADDEHLFLAAGDTQIAAAIQRSDIA